MLQKVWQKTSVRWAGAVLGLCGMLALALLASGASASAQRAQSTPVVQSTYQRQFIIHAANAGIIAPYRTVNVNAYCPAGYIALTGTVNVYHPGSAGRPNIFALSRNAYAVEYSSPVPQYRGWTGRVLNRTQTPLQARVTADCYLLPAFSNQFSPYAPR